jgi:3-oxo-4-pregnene-20-carboxyl-CoA dehydrogenase alpha subunit
VDFALGETQQAAARVAACVLDQGGAAAPAGPVPVPGERTGAADSALWKELGQAGLLSLALPAWLGGDGLGILDTAAVLTEVGRRAAPVPALATLVLGVLPVVRWGDRDLQRALLAGVAAGDAVLTAALREPSDPMPPVPATTARLSDGRGVVSGVKIGVPYAAAADWILVPASIVSGGSVSGGSVSGGSVSGGTASGGTGVVIVDPSAGGVSLTLGHSSTAEPEYTLRLDEAPVRYVLGERVPGARVPGARVQGDRGPGHAADGGALADLYQLAVAGACCVADGALSAALSLTTAHVRTREQFGRPLAAFQSVAQQIADVYIAARTLHLATLSACWRLETGREAGRDLEVAAYWLADQAPAALRTCHHLHGGIGMDVTYPLHRYSSLVRDLVRFVGGTGYSLDRLGARV